jgi:hypothetical protein
MGFAGYVALSMQLYCRCLIALHLAVSVLEPAKPIAQYSAAGC